MADQQSEQRPEDSEKRDRISANESVSPSVSYGYRWSYEDQRAYEQKSDKKKRRHGAFVYAIVMSVAFLLCLGVLTGVLYYRDRSGVRLPESGDVLTTLQVAEAVRPGTVLIYVTTSSSYGYATGFFVREDGYIATNYHFLPDATNIRVTLYQSEESVSAKVVGYVADADLAVLKIEGTGYPVLKLGDSDKVKVGDTAIAIGNPAGLSCAWSTTQGIISAVNRTVMQTGTNSIQKLNMIQTDAPVNPGNSGGPLCNDRGEVIGIVTRKMTDYEALGLAIPINEAKTIIDRIISESTSQKADSPETAGRPVIGITGSTIMAGESFSYRDMVYLASHDGVLVLQVSPTGGARDVLEVADIILQIDGRDVQNIDHMLEMLSGYHVGDTVILNVDRLGTPMQVSVVLGKSE